MRVLITTAPLTGHLYPMVPLAGALRAAGHDVLVAAPGDFAATVTGAGLPCTATVAAMPFDAFMMTDRHGRRLEPSTDPVVRLARTSRAWGRLAVATLDGTARVVDRWRPHLIIHESTELAAPLVAATRGLPAVEHGWGLSRTGDVYRSAAEDELTPELAELGLAALPTPAAYLDPCPPSLQRADAEPGVPVRLVPYNGEAVVPPWLLEDREWPLVALTLGSSLMRHGRLRDFPALLADLMTSLAGSDLDVAVAVDDSIAATWPRLPANVVAAGRIPLGELAARCRLVVNHGGAGSVTSAVCAGTPQVVLPQTGDQFANAAGVARAGIGLALGPDEVDPGTIGDICRTVLGDPAFSRRAAEVAGEVAATPPPSAVVPLLEALAASPTRV